MDAASAPLPAAGQVLPGQVHYLSLGLAGGELALSPALAAGLGQPEDLDGLCAALQPDSALALRSALDAYGLPSALPVAGELLLSFRRLGGYHCRIEPLCRGGQMVSIQLLLTPTGSPRQDLDQRLADQDAVLAALVRTLADDVFLLDSEGIFLALWSSRPDKLILSPDQFLGRSYAELFPPDFSSRFGLAFEQALSGGEASLDYPAPDPSDTRWFRAQLLPLGSSGVRRVAVICREIVAERKAEQHRARLHQAREALFSLLAHDLRNALSSVGGFSQLLRRRKLLSPQADELVGRMQQAAEDANQLLQEMLFTHDLGVALPERLTLLLQETLRWFVIQTRDKGIAFSSEIPAELPVPAMPPAWFERLLKQLLDNALRFTPAGGEIRLVLQVGDGRLRVRVSDTGSGIPLELQPRFFDKATIRSAHSGGMGLYLSRLILQQHGGRIWFESSEQGGTTFYVELPLL